MSKVAIIGAGPSGLFLALYLTRNSSQFGHRLSVTLFEREENHDHQDRSNPDRSYTIDITGHGLKAVQTIGASLERRFDKELIAFHGIHAYTINKTLPYLEKGWTGSRGDICSALLHELEADLVDSNELIEVQFNWKSEVKSVNPDSGEVMWLRNIDDSEQRGFFDLIVGADGGGSMLRRLMETEGLLQTQKKSIPNYSRILHLDNNSPEHTLEPTLLHSFSISPWAVGGAILDLDNFAENAGSTSIDQANSPKKLYVQMGYDNDHPYSDAQSAQTTLENIKIPHNEIAHKSSKKAVSLRHYVSDAELDSFAARPVYHTGKTIKCSRLAINKCALLGDAATAFPPVGQGVNAALESASILGKCLVEKFKETDSKIEIGNALHDYNEEWLPQANACADIANTIVYGSFLSRTKLMLQGAIAEIFRIDLAAAQLAKSSEISYVEALRRSRIRNLVAIAVVVTLPILILLFKIFF